MTKAEELLNSLDETDESLYPEVVEEEPSEPVRLAALYAATATETDEPRVVIFDDRSMYVPDSIKKIGVQFDHDVNLIRFDCPRYSDGVDLYPMQFYVNYIRPDGTPGAYHVEDVTIDETDSTILHFSWHVLRHATEYQGNLTILVCVKETDDSGNLEHHWNTELNTDFYLSEGLECADTILAEYPDIITQLLTEMDVVKAIATPEAMQGYANAWLNQYGTETVRSVEQKGQEVLASIPEDYTQLSNDVNELKGDLSNVDDAVKRQIVIPTKKRTLNSYTGYSEEIAKVYENERWIVAFSEYSNKISIRNLKSSWVDLSDVMNQDNNTCEINITANGSLRVNNEGTSYTGSYIAFNTTGNDKLHTFILNNGINSNAELYNVNQYIENYLLKNVQNVSEGYIISIDQLTNSNLFVEHAISSSGVVSLRGYNDTLKKYRFDVNKQKKYVVVVDANIKNNSGVTIGSFYTTEGLQIRYSTGNVGLNCDVLDTNGYYCEGSTANFVYSIPDGTTKNVRIIGKFSAENLELTSVYWTISLNRFRESGSFTNIVSGITSKVLNCWVFEDTGYSNYELENYVGKRILSEDVIVKNAEHANYSDKIKTIFEGKKIVTYGDSITANGGWQDYLRTYFECTIVNKGIGGTTVANNGSENYFCLQSRIDTIPQDADAVIIMGGTNDSGQSIQLGDLNYNEGFDTIKFKGALATTIRMIQTRCPNAMIFVASPCSGRGTSGQNMDTVTFNNIGLTTYDYAKACKEVAEYFSTPYIPIFEECGINPWNRKEYIADSVHPNDLGKIQIAMVFIKYLKMYGNID